MIHTHVCVLTIWILQGILTKTDILIEYCLLE